MDEAEENFFLSGARSKTTETVSVGGRERQRHFVIAKGTPRGFVAFSVEAQEHVDSHGSTLVTVALSIKEQVKALLNRLPKRSSKPHPRDTPLPSPDAHEPVEICMPVCTV